MKKRKNLPAISKETPVWVFGCVCVEAMAEYGGGISLSQQPPSSDESSDEHSPLRTAARSKKVAAAETGTGTGKKPRGRPPGSKNKPKPPIVITKEEGGMKPVVIEISAGNDVVETLLHFARKRHVGLSVLSGSGSVSNVTLRHPMSHSLSLHGPFSLVSLSGSFLHNTTSSPSPSPSPSFGICLAGAQGQVCSNTQKPQKKKPLLLFIFLFFRR